MKILITEGQYYTIKENIEKNKRFLTKIMGVDFEDNIQMVTSMNDIPREFENGINYNYIRPMLNYWGPMYLFNLNGKDYLYQDRGDFEWFIDADGFEFVDDEILEQLGIGEMGIKFSDIIKMFHNEYL
jgi:hypothetical protein